MNQINPMDALKYMQNYRQQKPDANPQEEVMEFIRQNNISQAQLNTIQNKATVLMNIMRMMHLI